MGRGLLINMKKDGERMNPSEVVAVSDLENFETAKGIRY